MLNWVTTMLTNTEVIISVREFATANRVSSTYAYRVLKDCAESLPNKKLAVTLYKDLSAENTDELLVVRPNHSKYKTIATECHWVQNATYVEQTGFITLYFSDLVGHIISNTGKAYTKYDYLKTIDFKGCSTKRLYELVLKSKDIGKTPTMTIYEWKEYLGYIDSYPEVSEFRRRVLDYGLKQINAQGDFEVTLDPTGLGRSFTHFSMIIKKLKSSKLNHTSKVSPRPYPIEVVSRYVVAAHQSGYQDVLADVLAHPPNTHTGQDHSI